MINIKYQPAATANAFALTVVFINFVCVLGILLLPELAMSIAQSWFHGLDISKIWTLNITVQSLVLGLMTLGIFSWLAGYLFATLYNYFAKK